MSASEATHHRRSATGRGGASVSVSDDSDDDQSWLSMSESVNVQRKSCVSDCPVEEVDLENGVLELKKVLPLSKVERNCRICHLGLERGGGTDSGSGVPIDLGCSCKGDLGAAHKQCAETWFKIKGDTTCEICGVTAFNISSEQINESNATTAMSASVPAAPMILVETRTMWHGRRFINATKTAISWTSVISLPNENSDAIPRAFCFCSNGVI